MLVEAALQNEKGSYLTSTGALSVRSGAKTGRSPKDKRVVAEPGVYSPAGFPFPVSSARLHLPTLTLRPTGSVENVWWGPVNIKLSEQSFMINRERAIDYLNTRDRIYVIDGAPSPLTASSEPNAMARCAGLFR